MALLAHLRPPTTVILPVLLAVLLAVASLPNTAAAGGDPQAKPRDLRVMTYNIHHGAGNDACTPPPPPPPGVPPPPDCGLNLQRIADIIRAQDPDVVGLQEVDRFWARSAYVDQVAWLARELRMHSCYGANLVHEPDNHANVPHQYGNAILSRYPILECTNTFLPMVLVEGQRNEQRGLLAALVNVRGVPLRFYNTHLHTRYADRKAQVAAIVEQIGTPQEPVILVGDLNVVPAPAGTELVPLYERFDDAWVKAGDGPGYTYHADPVEDPDRRIDYIFISRNITVSDATVPITPVTRLASDHYPVVADVALPGSQVGVGR